MADRRGFNIATEEEIRSGRVTDVYFQRALAALRTRQVDKVVVGEVRVRHLPESWPWGVLVGVQEVARLLQGLPIKAWAPPEGSLFRPGEPVLTIERQTKAFGLLETAFLGMLCQASGIATKSARCRIAAGERTLLSFGARRMHPALAPMIERACYVGGCNGVSTLLAADLIGIPPTGTMPHALVLILGDTLEAAWAFDESVDPDVKRIVLIDTFADEKFETLRVAEAMGDKLFGVRFDTPGSRPGDLAEIMAETRWELDLRGYRQVKLFASGGLDEHRIPELNPVCDGYGVGTSLSNAPTVNFSFDIVEIEGEPIAKRGKRSGGKFIALCPECGQRQLLSWRESPGRCACGAERRWLNEPLVQGGKLIAKMRDATEIRAWVLDQQSELTKGG